MKGRSFMPANAANYPRPQGNWIKYDGNPIFGNAEIGTCFDVHMQDRRWTLPHVFFMASESIHRIYRKR